MPDWFSFKWVFVGWFITLLIHNNNIKRSSISDIKDDLLDLLNELSGLKWLDDTDSSLYQEERYNTKVSRISWKLKQLNKMASDTLVEESKLNPLYNFDIETYVDQETDLTEKCTLKHHLQECCDDIVDTVEKNHFNKIMSSKFYIFWASRYVSFGVLAWLLIVYLYIQIISFLYK